ncbi:MAG: InlB B-repeat-containing protein [Breznakia sp.]
MSNFSKKKSKWLFKLFVVFGLIAASMGSVLANESVYDESENVKEVKSTSSERAEEGNLFSVSFGNVGGKFKVAVYDRTVGSSPVGKILGETITSDKVYTVPTGGGFTIERLVEQGYDVDYWEVDGVRQGDTVGSRKIINVKDGVNRSFKMYAKNKLFEITAGVDDSDIGKGSISPEGTASVKSFSDKTYTVKANQGYDINYVAIDQEIINETNALTNRFGEYTISADRKEATFTFKNITEKHTIAPRFKEALPEELSAKVKVGNGGSLLVEAWEEHYVNNKPTTPVLEKIVAGGTSGSYMYPYGGDITFSPLPNPGYRVDYWKLSDGATSTNQYGFAYLNSTEEKNIEVYFKKAEFQINASSGVGGTISSPGSTTVLGTENKTYMITPDAGYKISDVLVDGTSVGALSTYDFKNVVKDHTIEAMFEKAVYAVNFDIATNGGEGDAPEAQALHAGDYVSKPADPIRDGYNFIGWFDATTGGNQWDFASNVVTDTDVTLYAQFEVIEVAPSIDVEEPIVEVAPSVDTGDTSMMVTWISLLVISLFGIIIFRNKKNVHSK